MGAASCFIYWSEAWCTLDASRIVCTSGDRPWTLGHAGCGVICGVVNLCRDTGHGASTTCGVLVGLHQ